MTAGGHSDCWRTKEHIELKGYEQYGCIKPKIRGKLPTMYLYTPVGIRGTADKATSHFMRGLPVTVVKWTIVRPPIYQSTLIIDLLVLIIDLLMPIISKPP